MTESGAFKVEGGAIKVGKKFGKHGVFLDIPVSSGNSFIIEQAIDSCLLDAEGDGVKKLQQNGVPQKSIS